jgi:hypothetical protein
MNVVKVGVLTLCVGFFGALVGQRAINRVEPFAEAAPLVIRTPRGSIVDTIRWDRIVFI